MAKKLNRLISKYIREIAEEQTEVGPGEELLVTKAEKLARTLWHRALATGPPRVGKNGKIIRPVVDMTAVNIILERMEGKVLNTEELDNKENSIPDRISKIGKDKINKIGSETGHLE